MMYSYFAIFEFEEIQIENVFSISIFLPDFNCATCADTDEEGIQMAEDLLKLCIEGKISDGEVLPEPRERKDYVNELKPNQKLVEITVIYNGAVDDE